MGRRPESRSAASAAEFSFITSPGTISTLGYGAIVSANTGSSDLSSSTETTLPARWASSAVSGPMPGPILQYTAAAVSLGRRRDVVRHLGVDEEILPHRFGKMESVPPQQLPDRVIVTKVHKNAAFLDGCPVAAGKALSVYQKISRLKTPETPPSPAQRTPPASA